MTKKTIVVLCVALSFMFCFISIGFAALTDTLKITGKAEVEIPSGLFITNIELVRVSGLDVYDISYTPFTTTVDCSLSKSSNRVAGSVTYKITVYNNTEQEYAYRQLYYQSNLSGYNNNYVSESSDNSKIRVAVDYPKDSGGNYEVIPKGGTKTFEVTYTLGSSSKTFPSQNTYKTMLNYQFGINVDSPEQAIDIVHDKFLDVLNTTSTYEMLVDVLDNKFDGSQEWTSNYVGNVGNAPSADSVAVETLFAGQLQLTIDGTSTPATVIIKHENLDNNTSTGDDYVATNTSNGGVFRGYGCEMTLYLTTDDLSTRNGWADVYVTVFTCDRDANGNIVSDWYKIGEIYKGEANIVGYNGESGGTGSFVTDNWKAYAADYEVTENFSYSVAAGDTIKTLVQTVDARMTAEFQSLLDEAKAIIEDTTYAGAGITVVEDAYERASRFFTLDADGNPVADASVTRAQLCPIVKDLETNIQSAQDKIDEILGRG